MNKECDTLLFMIYRYARQGFSDADINRMIGLDSRYLTNRKARDVILRQNLEKIRKRSKKQLNEERKNG